MNRARPGRFCAICRTDIAAILAAGGEYLFQAMRRQTDCGICDACQRKRLAAALEYQSACAAVRLAMQMGTRITPAAMKRRIDTADRRCVALKMWPATR